MKFASLWFLALLFAAQSAFAQASQTSASRDPQAVALLTQALAAVGGGSAVSAIRDFTATGTITYFWAGEEVSGTVTVRGLGFSLFRLDAQLPSGDRSWFVTDIRGSVKDSDGVIKPIQYSNAVSKGCLTFPFLRIAAALSDPTFGISMAGTTTVNRRAGTVIQVRQTFPATDDPAQDQARLNTKDYVIDSQTFALLETRDTLYSDDGRMLPVTHQVLFSNFTPANGVSVPYSIVQKIDGQETWSMQLNSINFNTGLGADTFQF